jgi:selenide,water dikinase
MAALNRAAAAAARQLGSAIHAVTDVTGFGLLGHGHEMAHLSGCGLQIDYAALPWLPGAQNYARDWVFPGGSERNEAFYSKWVGVERSLTDWERRLLFDPQTSGGLLIALDPTVAAAFLKAVPGWVIGKVMASEAGQIKIV